MRLPSGFPTRKASVLSLLSSGHEQGQALRRVAAVVGTRVPSTHPQISWAHSALAAPALTPAPWEKLCG